MHDLVIRGGSVIDGSVDATRTTADVAIRDGRIVEVGKVSGPARRELDADGLLVTPGFVDIHTHYDGQASWDQVMSPSFDNGVTSVIMGNCGVGFAPAHPDQREWLIGMMEGVEEIPGTALHDGLDWNWESFPQYLDALAAKPRTIDVGSLIAHGPLRAYVMGPRCETQLTADPQDCAQMARIVREAMDAGAFGVSTSRTLYHRSTTGELVPGTYADEEELVAIGKAIRESGHGVLEVVPMGVAGDDPDGHVQEIRFLRRVAQRAGVEVQFLLGQYNERPGAWRDMLDIVEAADAEGVRMRPLVFGRGTGVLFSHQATNPFSRFPSYQALSGLSPEERLRALRDPEVQERILADHDPIQDEWSRLSNNPWKSTYVLGEGANYEPSPDDSVDAIARRQGRDPARVGYELMLEQDGRAFLSYPLIGYSDYNLNAIREMLIHPLTVLSGSDAGAHCNTICDAAMSTFMITHWTRDRTRGPKLPLEWVIHKQTRDTAMAMNMADRGLLRPGMIADVNLIDYDNLRLLPPEYVRDLPGGAGRLIQRGGGYVATIKTGEVIAENGQQTGARPGKVLRSLPVQTRAAA